MLYLGTLDRHSLYTRFLFSSLRTSVNHSIRSCRQITIDSRQINILFAISREAFSFDNITQQQRFMQKKIAKEMYNCKHLTHMSTDMRKKLKFLHSIFMDEITYPINTPITHLIHRYPDCTTFGDVCLEACGGFYHHPQLWWHFEFLQEIKNLTIKHYTVLTRDKLTDKLVSVNIFEFVTKIINYSAILVILSATPTISSTEFPVLLNWTDKKHHQVMDTKSRH